MSTHRELERYELAHARWTKSSRSGTGGGSCVEVAELDDGRRAIRDSKNPTHAVLIFTPSEWAAFTTGVRSDQFG